MMFHWVETTIRTNEDAAWMVRQFREQLPKIGGFDTETTGLHIICDKPFLFQFGWINYETRYGYSFVVDMEKQPILASQVIRAWYKLAYTLEVYLAHNAKYDLHMKTNAGFPYLKENVSDTMFYIRYGHDAISERNGGVPLALKEYGTQYIDRAAARHEAKLKAEQTNRAKALNLILKQRLGKGWTLKKLDDFFDDKLHDADDLDPESKKAYLFWLNNDVPEYMRYKIHGRVESEDIPYNVLDRETLIQYAHYDIVLLLETYASLAPVVEARSNMLPVEIEDKLIFPLYEMEREGFDVDYAYLLQAKKDMKQYIIQRREYLYSMVGQPFKLGQHALIKDMLEQKFNVIMASTKAEELTREADALRRTQPTHPAIAFIDTLQELRTLEKWYAVYLIRFINSLKRTDKLYTTIQQVGAVSGRVTSDFQQFPRKGIKTVDGKELFTPRKLVLSPSGEYDGIVYIDYSQIELRLQGIYTILVGHPEPNLLKAYMPWGYYNERGELFDCSNRAHICSWNDNWYSDNEHKERWTPLDVHAATTCNAFNITVDDPNFKTLRSDGKTLNFQKNYRGSIAATRRMFPTKTEDEIRRIDGAYYKAFPGIRSYHDYCDRMAAARSFATNLFGVKYYNTTGHHLTNMLIQGSGAFLLKIKIRELYDYCKANHIKSRFQMNIHDELSWKKHREEKEVFFVFKRIMEDWPDTLIPIVAEMAYTRRAWADKKDVKEVEDFEKVQ